MPLWFNKKIDLQPGEILFAAKNACSYTDIQKVLGVGRVTIKQYSDRLIHPETREVLSVWLAREFIKNKDLRRKHKRNTNGKVWRVTAADVLMGKHPNIEKRRLRELLIRDGIFEEKCNSCGFEERRVIDYQVPLVLVWKDGNMKNHSMDNIELICYNCYFLNYAEFEMKTQKSSKADLYKIKH